MQPKRVKPAGTKKTGRIKFIFAIIILAATILTAAEPVEKPNNLPLRNRVLSLRRIQAEDAKNILTTLGIGQAISQIPSTNALVVTAPAEDLATAADIVELIDSTEKYVLKIIPADPDKLPTSEALSKAIPSVAFGTLPKPPISVREKIKVIVDNYKGKTVVLAPENLVDLITTTIEKIQNSAEELSTKAFKDANSADTNTPPAESDELFGEFFSAIADAEKKAAEKPAVEPNLPSALPQPPPQAASPEPIEEEPTEALPEPQQQLPPAVEANIFPETAQMEIPNGDETLELNLPERVEIVALLDLLGKYLKIDYLYDPAKIKGDVTLKLQGQLTVKQFYALVESVMKFSGFAMSRKGDLVTIVPVAEALDLDPTFRTDFENIRPGDVIITKVFNLNYISTTAAKTLLTNMKLGSSIFDVPETSTIIVTEFAFRMDRISQLLVLIDQPGPPKSFRFRQLKYTLAKDLSGKIKTLTEQLGTVSITIGQPQTATPQQPQQRGRPRPQPAASPEQAATSSSSGNIYLDVDERTNRILMIGMETELAMVEQLIDAFDVPQQDFRTIKEYEIKNVDAQKIIDTLSTLGIATTVGSGTAIGRAIPQRQQQEQPPQTTAGAVITSTTEQPQIALLETTNSLLVNATPEQHIQITLIIAYVDREPTESAIPYVIYPLENQDPEELAKVLTELVERTIKDQEGKVQTKITLEDNIIIVPNIKTFSIIVYASRKNQEWIGSLIKTLDKRRPQVLIDVTLVEVSKTDTFDFDLKLASKFPVMKSGDNMDVVGSILGGAGSTSSTFPSGKSSAEAFSSPITGVGQGFYSDRHIQALLTAMQTKNYGRVLARPKVLVNDNETGTIKTEDTTYVAENTIVDSEAGTQRIETKYTPYNAGIQLDIKPTISEGNLLRLEIAVTRSDFRPTSEETKPPDTTKSDLKTVVTVPDKNTIILGGLVKLNQSKGGSKVPLLGDIPLVGALFRSVSNSDTQSKLYVFVKATILRPDETLSVLPDLQKISIENRSGFENAEKEFQDYQDFPAIKPKPVPPPKILDAE